MRSSRFALAFRTLLIVGCLAIAMLPVTPASALPPCGGPWIGPMGTSCLFTVSGPTISISGVGLGLAPTAVGIIVYDAASVYVGGCADYQPANPVASCNTSFPSTGAGVYLCVVKGLSAGVYRCID